MSEHSKRPPQTHGEAFQRGLENSRIKSHGAGLLRALIVAGAATIAVYVPIAWYWKIPLFLLIMGLAVAVAAIYHRGREYDDLLKP